MYDFKFADIGEGIHEGKLLKWFYKVGDTVNEGETLCIIETDKVNAEIPSPVTGKITKLGSKLGEVIHVGDTLVLIQTDSSDEPVKKTEVVAEEGENAGVVGQIEVSSEVIASSYEEKPIQKNDTVVLASPLARKLASDHNIDIQSLKGSGDFGRVLKTDVENAVDKPMTKPSKPITPAYKFEPSQNTRRVPITSVRKAIVNAMTLSKQIIPHTVLMDEIDVTELVQFRQAQKPLAEAALVHLTYMPFIIKALTKTIQEFPIFNASFDHEALEIIYKDFINIGFATDTTEGLMVPNIKNADQLSIFELARQLKSLQTQAIERTIQLKDIQNGTFTVTNYGAFDATFGAPIIKYPEVAIMGVGKIAPKPVVKNNEIVIAQILPISFAVDHRIIDGADAGRFVMRFKHYLMNPMLLLLA
ncbi:MAG: dihydrolipoamide acyltransferase [Tenericutes bacterium HGW-Tenericutes-1]|nr:MAG: dihydrolipoamide acyltransferase [Tenericutes bacterium HGW-Tenericutes-1]